MNEVYSVLGTPGVGFFSLLIIGALAGWIAEKITKSDHGILTNIVVGIAGSFVGSTLATSFNIAVNGGLARLLAAVVGAVIVVYGWRLIRGRQDPPQQQAGQGQPMPPDGQSYGNQPQGNQPYGNQPYGNAPQGNQPMSPQGGQYDSGGQPQDGYGNPQGGRYGNQPGQYGEPQGEWINEPPPGYQGGDQGGYGEPPQQPGRGNYRDRPPYDNNSPLDRK